MNFTTIVRDLNCQAIHLLTEGHFQRANVVLGSALQQLRQRADSTESSTDCVGKNEEFNFLYATPLTNDKFEHIQGEFVFYDKAFFVDDLQRACYKINIDQQIEIATTVVLYNMAMTYHLHGIIKGESSALQKATHLYNLCVQALDEETLDHAPMMQKLLLATYNNMGHIYSLFCDRDKVSSCKETVAAIMRGFNICYLSEDEVDFFHLSYLICSDSLELNTAPAA